MEIDRFYAQAKEVIPPFKFDEGVAGVFDDMVSRSVPFYDEIHKIILDLGRYCLNDGDIVYDLGCSTGSTFELLSSFYGHKNLEFIGIDNSQAMIDKAREKLGKLAELHCQDITEIEFKKSAMIIMNYTLQFLGPIHRQDILCKIYKSLKPGGMFILSEKIESPDDSIQALTTDLYYDFKRRNGYSELEISQKREALEDVLIPFTPEKQIQQLKNAGFTKVEMIFRWYNFALYLGIK